ncbi:MAG: serine/threonine protein kinase, partial [Candidatus Heimdallarchaeota archaeon]|nr:serine/threonine protein kinase [Candidatus Heimdallarchaeota archaeon]
MSIFISIIFEDVINYATQIAEGLNAAHKKGVTHRDIKSSNIMITDEKQVKIMDFGVAKVRGGAQVTKVGTTLGTAAYMSPEQARGEEADHRSDIWSFGVVLYEMLTGKLPFGGDYEQAVMYAIMNEEPQLADEVPSNLQPILRKALAKDQTERYQNIDELHSDLKSSEESSTTRTKAARKVRKQGASNKTTLYLGGAVVLLAVAYFLNRSQPIDSIAVL